MGNQAGQLPHVALAHAERKFLQSARNENLHPHYWAGFIAVGRIDSAEAVSTNVALR